jgi:DNA-binding transcriptional regulator YhcF (GntR family)
MLVSDNHRSVLPVYATRAKSETAASQLGPSEQFISRRSLASRWGCSVETIKRRTRDGMLHPIRFNARMIRYQLSEVIRVEREAGGRS